MKKMLVLCIILTKVGYTQTNKLLDTMTVNGGVKLDQGISSYKNPRDLQGTEPKECDTCIRYDNTDVIYQLQKHPVKQNGYWLLKQPIVRTSKGFIYEIVVEYERGLNDSTKYASLKTTYGNPVFRDTSVNGKIIKYSKWESPKRRLIYVSEGNKFLITLTDKTVENELLIHYLERTNSNKRDNLAKEQLKKLPVKGNGKGTFVISLSHLEMVLSTCNTYSLQNQFNEWFLITDPEKTNVAWPYNDKTQQRDIPEFRLNYMTKIKDANILVWVKVPKSIFEKIYSIEVRTEMDGMKYAQLKNSVKNAGYLINEHLTQLLNKETWQHKTKPYSITLSHSNGTAFIVIDDSKRYAKFFGK